MIFIIPITNIYECGVKIGDGDFCHLMTEIYDDRWLEINSLLRVNLAMAMATIAK